MAMIKCPNCGKPMQAGGICKNCGYDDSKGKGGSKKPAPSKKTPAKKAPAKKGGFPFQKGTGY